VFPGEIHHILPLERPECWVTCDSIGLFLETECQFPFESEDDFCYYHEELEVPRYRRQGCCLTKLFVKKVSVELIELYLRFVSPVNPRFLMLLFFDHLLCSAHHISNGALRIQPLPPFRACSYMESIRLRFVIPTSCDSHSLRIRRSLSNLSWKIRCTDR